MDPADEWETRALYARLAVLSLPATCLFLGVWLWSGVVALGGIVAGVFQLAVILVIVARDGWHADVSESLIGPAGPLPELPSSTADRVAGVTGTRDPP